MAYEGLKVIRHSLLSFIVPDLEEVVLATSQHVATVEGKVGAGHSTLVDSM